MLTPIGKQSLWSKNESMKNRRRVVIGKNNENHVDGMWITIFEKAPYQGLVCEDDVLGFFFAAEPESSLESDCVDWAF